MSLQDDLLTLTAEILYGEPRAGLLDRPDTTGLVSLGGDSLTALRLVASARERHGVAVEVPGLLRDEPLVRVLGSARPIGTDAGPAPVDSDSATRLQKGMWTAERLSGGTPYNLVFTAHLDGPLDRDLLREAVTAVVQRHEGLRTRFSEVDGELRRVVESRARPVIDTVAPDPTMPDPVAEADALAARLAAQPWDVEAAPPVRFTLLGDGDRHALVMVVHHMLVDGWAIGVVLREIFAHYDAARNGDRIDLPPAVGIEALLTELRTAEEDGTADADLAYWSDRIVDVDRVLELPADRVRHPDSAGDRESFDLDVAVTGRVEATARRLGITPFSFLLGAYGLTLSRFADVDELLVAVFMSGRTTEDLAAMVAPAVNLVPVHVRVDDEAVVDRWLTGLHRTVCEAIAHSGVPFDRVVSALGASGARARNPLVQVAFGMHDQLVPERLTAGGLSVRIREGHGGGSPFDLTLFVSRSRPCLGGDLEFDTGMWTRDEADNLLASYQEVVAELVDGPDLPLGRVRGISPGQRATLDTLDRTAEAPPDRCVEALFAETAERCPEAVAVRELDTVLTYDELRHAVTVQARLLREAGVGEGDTVTIALPRSIAEVVAVLGVLWAGARYVGVDPAAPRSWVDTALSRFSPAAGIGVHHGGTAVAAWNPQWRDEPGLDSRVAPDDGDRLAYLAFTSGSTGVPKATMVRHRGVVRLVADSAHHTETGAGVRWLRLAPLAFDASTLELFGPLLTGGALEIHPDGLPSPHDLALFVAARGITTMWLTVGLFHVIAEFAPECFTDVTHLLTGGDVVPAPWVRRVTRRHPGLRVTNGYGPTENTTFTATHTVEPGEPVEDPLPIGTPLLGDVVHVLDRHGRPVPPGAVGELHVGGAGLAAGYLGDPDQTARVFGRLSPAVDRTLYRTGDLARVDTTGRLRFHGRRDEQVKIRGHRVEPAEIRTVLENHPGVGQAAVVVDTPPDGSKRLLAAVVPADAELTAVMLRDFLASRLPDYCVPSRWALVAALPTTANGKLDRAELVRRGHAAESTDRDVEAEPGEVERTLMAMWHELLGVERVGLDDDFFALGGHSLSAARLLARIRAEYGVDLPIREFFAAPTVGGAAAAVARISATETDPELLERLLDELDAAPAPDHGGPHR